MKYHESQRVEWIYMKKPLYPHTLILTYNHTYTSSHPFLSSQKNLSNLPNLSSRQGIFCSGVRLVLTRILPFLKTLKTS